MNTQINEVIAIQVKGIKFYSDAKQAVLNALSEYLQGTFWFATVAVYEDKKPYEFINVVVSKEKPDVISTLNNQVEYQKLSNPSRPKITYGEHIEIEIEDVIMICNQFGWRFK